MTKEFDLDERLINSLLPLLTYLKPYQKHLRVITLRDD